MRTTVLLLALAVPAFAELRPAETGRVKFKAIDDQKAVADRYRLDPVEFEYRLKPQRELVVSGVEVYDLTFPSPVKSPHESNNTVYGEYYVPKGKGPFPGVIVLDILDGSQVVSRGIANVLAQNGIAALCVQMAYYGPRRPAGEKVRLLSPDLDQTMAAIRQTVLDNRCAAAWLAARPEIDAKKLGIHGTSLGSFMGALTAAAEPRLHNVSLLLGGGGLVDAYWDHPRAQPILTALSIAGVSKDMAKTAIAPADPLTYADRLKQRNLLMIAASRDDVVPPSAAKALWEATGKQKIVWYNATHVGAAVYLFEATNHIVKHFK
ncbi:MAG TPA: prolyl oligopeptidase family serine peptidase [Gemmataceae bacterium]|jgi:dienelactone hydrolase|nr:prolyl oligopeptidase family serine peptidase [Gemmataceae bacterium]